MLKKGRKNPPTNDPFISSSLSLTLLLEGNNELPGFNVVAQKKLIWEELFHLRRDVQVFALHVRQQCDLKPFKRQKNTQIIHHSYTDKHQPLFIVCFL